MVREAKNEKPTLFQNWLTPPQNPFDVFAQNSATDQPSMPPTNGQNLVHIAAVAFWLDKKVGWANAKSTHARIPQARSKLDTLLTKIMFQNIPTLIMQD